MKFTQTKTEEVEVEIQFPHYRKTICHAYKVIDEKKCLAVCDLEGWEEIGAVKPSQAFFNESKESTEDYFNKQYQKVLKRLQP